MRWLAWVFTFVSVATMADEARIREAITGINPMIQIKSVNAVVETPFFEVNLMSGERVYTDKSGLYFVAGDLYKIGTDGVKNLTEISRRVDRQAILKDLEPSKLVVFSPVEEVRHRLLVFTDIDCGYCRRLHSEIDQLLENGVEIRYAAFPRAGVGSDSYDKYVSVYCAKDQNAAMTLAKAGETPEAATCYNPVSDQYQLGQKLGITGTPTLIFDNGEMQPGYLPWRDLLERMNQLGS
ncbi:MAG: protein-disulfide isomerase [Gammaproteobacteria bacterium]|nr:protein-disulfide isomerase [Gammaproteobacteria bacterium]|tara:strand:+ start:1082 stop:1795 length:714 start_codon:yes stop_codon:yes gene_type:complete